MKCQTLKYELLQHECARDIENVAEDISRSITQIKSLGAGTTCQKKIKDLIKAIESKINTFFTMCLAKFLFHGILEDLRTTFNHDSNIRSKHAMQEALLFCILLRCLFPSPVVPL